MEEASIPCVRIIIIIIIIIIIWTVEREDWTEHRSVIDEEDNQRRFDEYVRISCLIQDSVEVWNKKLTGVDEGDDSHCRRLLW